MYIYCNTVYNKIENYLNFNGKFVIKMTASSSKDPRYFLLDTVPTILDKEIHSRNLPTYKQVLLSFLAHLEDLRKIDSNRNLKCVREAAKATVDIVMVFYGKANIPTVHHNKMCEKIENFNKKMQDLMRLSDERRKEGTKGYEDIEKIKKQLDEIFIFWLEMLWTK